ncbi:transient receptor potential cation channel protein painless-like [Planococcus citri]|uniref:transient receptor potential cation channel protein painless-like n=1 Tax=Planococcus citri TaxID=170843 RepID=UPI0031F7AA8F
MDRVVTKAMYSTVEDEVEIMSEIEEHINHIVEKMKDDEISLDDCDIIESDRLMILIKQLKLQGDTTIGTCSRPGKVFKHDWIREIITNFCPKTAKQLQKESDESTTSIMRAARHGNFLHLQTLLKNERKKQLNAAAGKTILLALLDGIIAYKYKKYPGRVLLENLIADKGVRESIRDSFFPPTETSEFPGQTPDHYQCLEHILKKVPINQLDINFEDVHGNTALHYAVAWQEAKAIGLLLQNGAYMCTENKNGMIPLKSINPEILQQYLDSCISSNNYPPEHTDYQITIDFKLFMPQQQQLGGEKQENICESKPVLILHEDSRFNKLLCHPVITSYLCLKWHKVKIFFYLNLMWYFIYWFLLNSYVFCISHQASNCTRNNTDDFHETINSAFGNVCKLPVSHCWKILIIISCSTLIYRELNQIWNLPTSYFKFKENWMEMCLFASTFYFLRVEQNSQISTVLAAAIVLVSWLELVLLIGRHPLLSTHIEMFKNVSENFFKHLFLYSIMVIAFAFSFYILFKDAKADGKSPSIFQFPTASIFKTFLMSISGFETSTITLSKATIWSQVFLLIFTFIVSIVLLNLLNGLAFGDTLKTQDASELIGITSRINFIAQVESMTALPFFKFIDKLCQWFCCCSFGKKSRKGSERVSIEEPSSTTSTFVKQNSALFFTKTIYSCICLSYTLKDCKIKIFPNRKLLSQIRCDRKIIEKAVDILKNKQSSKTQEMAEFCKQILQEIKMNSGLYYPPCEVCAAKGSN